MTTPEEVALLRAVAEAARGIRLGYVRLGTGNELAVIHGGDRMESALRALDAYQPLVESGECRQCAGAGKVNIVEIGRPHMVECVMCLGTGKPATPLSPAAQEARRPRPPGELVEALQDRVHKDVTERCPQCCGLLADVAQCRRCRGTGRVPVSRPARARKVRDGE